MKALDKKSTEALVDRFIKSELTALAAYRNKDIPRHNRWFDRARLSALALIDRGAEGRTALEALMQHESRTVRLAAAAHVRHWAPEAAVPVIEELALWAKDDRTEGLFGESMHVGLSAEMLLAEHYGLNILDVIDFVRAKRRGRTP